jgi:hypothetical protein
MATVIGCHWPSFLRDLHTNLLSKWQCRPGLLPLCVDTAAVLMPAALGGDPRGRARRGDVAAAGGIRGRGRAGGGRRARSHCRFVLPLINSIPDPRTYSVPLFLKRQCDQTLGGEPGAGAHPRAALGCRSADERRRQGERDGGVQGVRLKPLSLVYRASNRVLYVLSYPLQPLDLPG